MIPPVQPFANTRPKNLLSDADTRVSQINQSSARALLLPPSHAYAHALSHACCRFFFFSLPPTAAAAFFSVRLRDSAPLLAIPSAGHESCRDKNPRSRTSLGFDRRARAYGCVRTQPPCMAQRLQPSLASYPMSRLDRPRRLLRSHRTASHRIALHLRLHQTCFPKQLTYKYDTLCINLKNRRTHHGPTGACLAGQFRALAYTAQWKPMNCR